MLHYINECTKIQLFFRLCKCVGIQNHQIPLRHPFNIPQLAPLQALIIIPFLEMRAYIIKTQKKKSFAIAFKTSAKLFGARSRVILEHFSRRP